MEGYSVTEAASVLGVPTERVWELLARGVLAGAPEGDTGMRVYLQPRPAPAAREDRPPNGDGGRREPERELSPFRELLTEFRNLTERYGQALLALGEARGEVAALRSRVDLLEARMDLRLPTGATPGPAAAWSSAPMQSAVERTVMPAAPVEPTAPEEGDHPETDEEEEDRRARRRGPRRATESFAEALARAEDPSIPELPGGREAAAALAALREDSEPVDLGLPREVSAAEEVPIAEEAAAAAGAVDALVADHPAVEDAGDATASEAVEPSGVLTAEPEPVEPTQTEPPEAGWHDVEVAPVEVDVERAAPDLDAPEPDVDEGPEIVAEPAPAPATAPAPAAAGEQAAAEPLEWDSERYTTDIEEPDWFAGEAFEAVEPPSTQEAEPRDTAELAAADPVTVVEATPVEEETAPPPTVETSGADEMEVASGSHRGSPSAPEAPDLPGSEELDEALAALDALARPETSSEAGGPRVREEASEGSTDDADVDEWPPPSRAVSPTPAPGPAAAPMRRATATTGPATRAYRRLRRIFPA